MASTRNKNTPGNYCLEQREYKESSNYTLYPNSQYGAAYNTRLAGNGLNPVLAEFNAATERWVTKNVLLAESDWSVTASTDATGGKSIPAGTVYCQYEYDNQFNVSHKLCSPIYLPSLLH